MIEVVSKGPFTGAVVPWRGRSGESVHTVVIKATYELAQLTCKLVDRPRPIATRDEPFDSDPGSSVRVPADLLPWKRAAEVIVVGSAYSPGERPAASVVARIVVADVDKAVEAHAPRRFRPDGTLEEIAQTARMSLRLEHAARGVDGENPIGVDPSRADARGFRPVPSLLPPAHRITRPDEDLPCVSMAPIPSAWRTRGSLLRMEDVDWIADPTQRPVPSGFDPDVFQSAPRDQRLLAGLRPDERMILENLHPKHPRLVTNLPGISPRAVLLGPREEEISLVADTLWIDTDEQILTLTWRGYVSFDRAPPRCAILVVPVERGAASPPLGAPAAPHILHVTGRHHTMEMTQTDTDPLGINSPQNPLPFLSAEGSVDDEITLATKKGQLEGAEEAVHRIKKGRSLPPPMPSSRPMTRPVPPPPPPPPPVPPPPPSRASAPPPSPRPATASNPSLQTGAMPAAPSSPLLASPPMAPPMQAPAMPPPRASSPSIPSMISPMRPSGPVAAGSAPPAPMPPAPVTSVGLGPSLGSAGPPPLPSTVGASMPSTVGQKVMGSSSLATTPAGSAPQPPPSLRGAPPPANGASLFEAAFGAKSASDAAATRERERDRDRDRERERDKEPDASPRPPAAETVSRRALVDLLAYDDALPARLRRDPTHAKLLARGAPPKAFLRPDEAAGKEEAGDERTRWDVLRLLSFAAPLELNQLRDAVAASFDDETQLELPVIVVAGELRPSYEEAETLKLVSQIAQPLAGTNKAVPPLLKQIETATQASWPPTREIATSLVRQVEQAVNASPGLPPRWFAGQLERAMLESRRYKKRVLFGGPRLRADLTFPSGAEVPLYLPERAADLLPMLPSLPVVAAVELRPREDASETHAEALVALAVGRVVRRAAPKG